MKFLKELLLKILKGLCHLVRMRTNLINRGPLLIKFNP